MTLRPILFLPSHHALPQYLFPQYTETGSNDISATLSFIIMNDPLATRRNAARLAIVILALGIVVSLVSLVTLSVERQILQRAQAGETISMEEATASDDQRQIIGITEIGLMVLSIVTFLIWVNQANKSLQHLGVEGMNFTSGWAVGWFFIPIANLFRPYQVVQELWKGSDPETPPDDSTAWLQTPASALVGVWWGGELLSRMIGRVFNAQAKGAETLDQLSTSNTFAMGVEGIDMVAAGVAIMLIIGIEKRLRLKAETMEANMEISDGETFGEALA
jgi:hypothetical protein